jgi:Cysteine-rich secretory protein family
MDAPVPFRRLLHHACISRICRASRQAAQSACGISGDQCLPDQVWTEAGRPGCAAVASRCVQSKAQAGRSRIGHDGSDGSKPLQRAARAGFHAKIASENVAAGQKSFSDAMRSWEESSGHRENLLRPEVTAIGVAMAKNEDGRAYWTLVLGAE